MFSSCYESRARLPAPCPAVKLTQFLRHISPASYNVFLNEPWVLLLEFSKHPDSVFGPFAQKHAIMKIGERRLAEFLERLVVATAPTNSANPAGLADRLVAHLNAVDEFSQAAVLDSTLLHVAVLVLLTARKTMAQVNVAIAVDVQQSEPRSAREHLIGPHMQVGQHRAQVGEPGVLVVQRALDVNCAKLLESGYDLPQVGRVQAVVQTRFRSHRGKADFKESETTQMLVNPNDLDSALGDRDASDNRTRGVTLQEALHAAHDLVV